MVLVQDDNDFFTTLFLGLVLLGGFLMILLQDLVVNLVSKQYTLDVIKVQIGKWMIENNKEENI